jgi:putative membrane protein
MTETGAEQDQHDDGRYQVKATADSHFSWMRTRMSVERTMMSWVRTAVSLIGFGFTIVQFFERFSAFEGVSEANRPWAPRYLGLALIAAGILALVVSAWQYRSFLKYMWGAQFAPIAGWGKAPRQTPVYAITIGMIFIGLFAFFAILLRAI